MGTYFSRETSMPAVWLEHRQLSFRADAPAPLVGEGEALIEMILGGICSTDLELCQGYYPYTGILGHEFVGRVAQAPGAPEWEGRRVVGEINLTCGECEACLNGRSHHCEKRCVLGIANHHGAFARWLVLPLRNLHVVPDEVTDEAAVFTEPVAAAVQVQEQVHIHPGMRVLVVGAGRLGQLIAQTLALTGCELSVLARSAGARRLLEARQIRVVQPEDTAGMKADVVVEASGAPEGFSLARQAVRPAGTIILKSTYHGSLEVDFSAVVVDEITLVGSRCGSFAPALRLLRTGQVNPTVLIEARYPLSEAVKAFDHAARHGSLKVLLTPE
jgi:2-desacetyl-2-hydroxyethyl bacteriochlorophyllide A dehydrogenase